MKFGLALVAAVLAATGQPCLAAVESLGRDGLPQRGGAFVGAAMRMPLSANGRVKPAIRLQLSLERVSYTTSSSQVRKQIPVVELAGSFSRGARLYVAGQELGDAKSRLRLNGSNQDLLVGVGVAALLVVAVLLASQAHAGP